MTAVEKCFWCMEPISGEVSRIHVKRSFCHPSYWDKSEYGILDGDGETGYLFECEKCQEQDYEDYEFCCDCSLLFSDDAIVYDENEGDFVCRECWLERRDFSVERKYHKTDAWRGHMTAEGKGDTMVAVECCVIGHKDNERIMEITQQWLDDNGFEHLHYVERTSNVFSVNLIVLAKKSQMTDEDRELLKRLGKIFVDYYTRGFSIFSGETCPMDLERYERELKEI